MTTLEACGIQGSDAETSLATLCALAQATTLEAWRAQHQDSTPAELVTLYGSDACRAATVLSKHLPSPSHPSV